jgi:hypothetical protein
MEALPARATREGLARYYDERVATLLDGVIAVWGEWLGDEWACPPEALEILKEYAQKEQRVLRPFFDGTITRDDGTPYQAPRMTRVYRDRAGAAGLGRLKRSLARMTRRLPVTGAGEYDLVTAFSDTIMMVVQYGGPERRVLTTVRCNLPFRVSVTDGIHVTGTADLALLEQERVVQAEVHDYEHFRPAGPAVPRLLRVVALFHATGESWTGERQIIYRHMGTGFWVRVDWGESTTRLLPVITAALRGVQCGVFLPRLAVAERLCLRCPYYGLCVTQDGMDVLDDLDTTLLDVSHRAAEGLAVCETA